MHQAALGYARYAENGWDRVGFVSRVFSGRQSRQDLGLCFIVGVRGFLGFGQCQDLVLYFIVGISGVWIVSLMRRSGGFVILGVGGSEVWRNEDLEKRRLGKSKALRD